MQKVVGAGAWRVGKYSCNVSERNGWVGRCACERHKQAGRVLILRARMVRLKCGACRLWPFWTRIGTDVPHNGHRHHEGSLERELLCYDKIGTSVHLPAPKLVKFVRIQEHTGACKGAPQEEMPDSGAGKLSARTHCR
ncbi:unnamed protein product, partial [Sphacelaria rigidula]